MSFDQNQTMNRKKKLKNQKTKKQKTKRYGIGGTPFLK